METLRQGPPPHEAGIPRGRWSLASIRAAVPRLQDYSLSGVWRLLRRYRLKLRTASVQQYSPDPEYEPKLEHLLSCLREASQQPEQTVVLFLDEMGYYCWPEATQVWAEMAPVSRPVADRQQAKQQQWRLIGVLNALTGQVDYLDGYIVGRAKVSQMYEHLVSRYAWARRIYVVQDNWSIHRHPEVLETLTKYPQLEPVWLPTYAPWLNPIEKLWRWLRQDVLKMHRLAADWAELRQQVNAFLDQFATGSPQLLRYVGLAGQGKLARAIHDP